MNEFASFLHDPKALCGIYVLVSLLAIRLGGIRYIRRIEQSLASLGRRPIASVLLVFFLVLGIRLATLPWLHVPGPHINDEFSYLLGADTFASGRLTNPTPPLPRFFETFHVLQEPSRMSKYLPGQALFLAFGQFVFGYPWAGVLLSSALMCAAITWALFAWLPAGWAAFGGLLTVVPLGTFSYWANSYWGGSVAGLGGALFLGGLGRILRRRTTNIWPAFSAAIGSAVLLNTRPFEGVVMIALVGIGVLARRDRLIRIANRRVVIPTVCVFTITSAWMLFYNWRITGNSFHLPYSVYTNQYDPVPVFYWQKMRPIPELNAEMSAITALFASQYQSRTGFHGFLTEAKRRWSLTFEFFFQPFLVALCGLPFVLRSRRSGWIVAASLAGLCCLHTSVWWHLHYIAPFVMVFFLVIVQCLRWLRVSLIRPHRERLVLIFGAAILMPIIFSNGVGAWRDWYTLRIAAVFFVLIALVLRYLPCMERRDNTGLAIAYCIPILIIAFTIHAYSSDRLPCCTDVSFGFLPLVRPTEGVRNEIIQQVSVVPGKHLIFVRWDPSAQHFEFGKEWLGRISVDNRANMQQARIMWAWDLGLGRNSDLALLFPDRNVWYLEMKDVNVLRREAAMKDRSKLLPESGSHLGLITGFEW